MDNVPELTDGVVTLRALGVADVDGIVEQCTDLESIRWTTVPVPYGPDDAVDWVTRMVPQGWADGGDLTFAVVHQGRFAGSVALFPGPSRVAEIAFGLAAWARGQGVASRAVRLLLDWGFGELGLSSVYWRANVGNWGSRRVAERAGFVIGPEVPNLLEQRGEFRDAWTGWLAAPR
ncbi:MAG TPA: GNAT family N-acetyltransferase [Actinokineospora sp.]|nr:GNAT family N-acetyltransferase [Actinokineospora sp.]